MNDLFSIYFIKYTNQLFNLQLIFFIILKNHINNTYLTFVFRWKLTFNPAAAYMSWLVWESRADFFVFFSPLNLRMLQ